MFKRGNEDYDYSINSKKSKDEISLSHKAVTRMDKIGYKPDDTHMKYVSGFLTGLGTAIPSLALNSVTLPLDIINGIQRGNKYLNDKEKHKV